jgi:hypothetical protein
MKRTIDDQALSSITEHWPSDNLTVEKIVVHENLMLPGERRSENPLKTLMFETMFFSSTMYGARSSFVENIGLALSRSKLLVGKFEEFVNSAKPFDPGMSVGFNAYWDLDGDFWLVDNGKCILAHDFADDFLFDDGARNVIDTIHRWGTFATCILPYRLRLP